MAEKEMDANYKKNTGLKKRLQEGISKSIPDISINGNEEHCLPNTLNVSFDGCEGEAILLYLDLALFLQSR